MREYLRKHFSMHDLLTGSYVRDTKTKPLTDVDLFCILEGKDSDYRSKPPSEVLEAFRSVLATKYGEGNVRTEHRCVVVRFGDTETGQDEDERVLSFDVVPAVAKGDDYEIPDSNSGSWMRTNPEIHAKLATEANASYAGEWKGLVRMMKKWNRVAGKPIDPSFLIEVMALQCLYGSFGGDYRYEMQALFSTLAARIHDSWPDPAGLGPAVSDAMTSAQKDAARMALQAGEAHCAEAIRHEREGRTGEALQVWRALFGSLFPLS
jgi:hypothetical protein